MRFFALSGVLFSFAVSLAAPLRANTVTVSTATQLVSAVNNASPGDTILLNNGTYAMSNEIDLNKAITLKGINGPANVTITVNSYFGIYITSSNVTVDGFTLTGPQWGVRADGQNGGVLSGLVVRNLSIGVTGSGGRPIAFNSVNNSIIEFCTFQNSANDALQLETSNYNVIVNNTVQQASAHGLLLENSDWNVIAANSVNNTGFFGALLNGSRYNYLSQNTMTSTSNGITFSQLSPGSVSARTSIRNYAGNNVMVLANKPGSDGFWINYDSDWNMVYLNDATGANENGMAIFNSVGNYIRGNYFHQNPQGGIFVSKDGGSGPTVPTYNVMQQNYLAMHPANGGVTTNNASNNDISFNYVAGDPAQIGQNIDGFLIQNTSSASIFANLIRDLRNGEQMDASTTSTFLYLNRHLNSPNHYAFAGATVQWDSGSTVLGGNYFYDFTSANGNPSTGATPYTNIIQDQSGHTGTYQDRYPYQSESLGKAYLVSALTPATGSSLAAASHKTISWNSQGCVLVDLTLLNAASSATAIVSNYADYGNYRWTVPSVAAGSYTIRIDCKDSSGSPVRASSTTGAFQITAPDLVLLSPQTNFVTNSGTSLLVSWTKSANVTAPVDVYIRYSDSSPYALLQGSVTTDFASITAPVVSSNRVSVRIVSGSYADSTDGWFTIRGSSSGQFTTPAAATNLYVGTPFPIEWVSPQNSDYVDIDLISGSTRNIATQLADFGKYLMLVPDLQGGGATLRLTFHNSSGTVLQQISSGSLAISTSASQPGSITATAGAPQLSTAGTRFGTAFQAQVKDANGNPLSGVAVTFQAPGSGPSGTFSSSATVTTNAQGLATAPAFTANSTAGSYTVTATTGVLTASFSVTNLPFSTSRIGVFQSGQWVLDGNANFQWDGAPPDKYFSFTAGAGDIAIAGDWNGDGRTKAGVYHNGFWLLDYNGNGQWDGTAGGDRFIALGGNGAGEIPVVGDWNGDGRTKVGFYYHGFWVLDYNGNGQWDGQSGGDRFIALGGSSGFVPVLGDWNGDGRTKVGYFNNGVWALDYNGNGVWDGTAGGDKFYNFSAGAGDIPVVGDWTGSHTTKIGVYHQGFWLLDLNGNGVWDGTTTDKFAAFGSNGYTPVVGDWNGDGKTKIGFYYQGFWALDFNGNGQWDGPGPASGADAFAGFGGAPGEQPIIGKW